MEDRAVSQQLTAQVKQWALDAGAALVGVASIDRFDPQPPYYDRAPQGHDPRDFVPEARAVISIAQPVLDAVVDAPAVLMDRWVELVPEEIKQPYLEMLYHHVGHRVQDEMLEQIGQRVGQRLQMEGFETMIFPTTGLHPAAAPSGPATDEEGPTDRQIWSGPSEQWADLYSPFRYTNGPLSHRHVATRAGLGEFGYNNIVLTPQFGPRQRFNSIVTEAPLAADPLITEPICLRDDCMLCLKACYMDAIRFRDDPAVQDYRSVPEVHKDLIFVDTPCRSYPTLCNARRTRVPHAPVRGDCVRICPVPKERERLPKRLQRLIADWKAGQADQPSSHWAPR